MSVNFLCTRCHSALQVPDEIAGRKAQCPHCGEIQTVPQGSTVPPIPPTSEFLPYETPPQLHPSSFFTPPPELRPTRVYFGDMFQNTWDIFFARFGDFLIVGLIVLGINMLFSGPEIVIATMTPLFQGDTQMVVLMSGIRIILSVLGAVVGMYLYLGGVRYALHLIRGGESRLSLLFPGLELFLKFFGSSILVWLLCATIVGFFAAIGFGLYAVIALANPQLPHENLAILICCAVTLIAFPVFLLLCVRWMCYVCFIADRNEGPVEAIQSSFRFSNGNVLPLFGLTIVYGVLSVFVALCTCGLGVVITMPLMYCYAAVAYLMMTGQPFVNPAKKQPGDYPWT